MANWPYAQESSLSYDLFFGSITESVSFVSLNLCVSLGERSNGGQRQLVNALAGAHHPTFTLRALVISFKPRILYFIDFDPDLRMSEWPRGHDSWPTTISIPG